MGKKSRSTNVIFYIFIFAKVRPVRTKVTDTHRDRHTQTDTNTETDNIIAINLVDLPKNRKRIEAINGFEICVFSDTFKTLSLYIFLLSML